MEEFNVGDTVILKSGGPAMTVASHPYGHPQSVVCQWFERESVKQASFLTGTLKSVKLDEQSGRNG